MKYGARNNLTAKVTEITSDKVMSLVKFEITVPARMASVLTTESLEDRDLKIDDKVQLIVKAINVLPVKFCALTRKVGISACYLVTRIIGLRAGSLKGKKRTRVARPSEGSEGVGRTAPIRGYVIS